MICPVCDGIGGQEKFIVCDRLDDSYMYENVTIYKCRTCGHLFNALNRTEIRNLNKFYTDEYFESHLMDKKRDMPGSDNIPTRIRYQRVYNLICSRIEEDSRILDIGCALGGFLKYLKELGCTNLYGIEPIEEHVNKANNKNIQVGNVYSIPFEDNYFDVVILDQVLEHLSNLKLAMKEIKRVLKKGGLCYIGVPDAERYNDLYFWLTREHIQHFKGVNLKLLAHNTGFELLAVDKSGTDMFASLKCPMVSVLLKVSGTIYCWGMGREFMYYYPNTRLRNLDLILIDDIPAKQKQTFKGMKIHSSDILKEADKDSFLIITANVYKDELTKRAKELGFKGEIINV